MKQTRMQKLEDKIVNCYFTRKAWHKLKAPDQNAIKNFILENESLDYNEFQQLVNRIGLSSNPYTKTFINKKLVDQVLSVLNKTVIGMYGYSGEQSWVHPFDRVKKEESK